MRLSYGPYEREGSSISINKTRLQFLWNAKARVPDITTDLYGICYPLYSEFSIIHFKKLLEIPHYKEKASSSLESLLENAPGWRHVKSSQESSELLDQLDKWSRRWNLNAEWCLRWAVRAMRAWISDEEARLCLSWCKSPELVRYILVPEFYPDLNFDYERLGDLRFFAYQLGIVDFGPDDEPNPIEFKPNHSMVIVPEDYIKYKDRLAPAPPQGIPNWWFTATSRDEYLKNVVYLAREDIKKSSLLSSVELSHQEAYISQVKGVAAAYCDSIEEFLSKQSGWKKAKVFPDYRAHLKHIVWAVKFQVEGKSYSDIARETEAEINQRPTVSTVKRAVNSILDTIALDTDRRQSVRRGPKCGSTHSASAKAIGEVLKSLGK